MQVRALCDHFHGTFRAEGAEWDHSGPLYEHIEPLKKAAADSEADEQQQGSSSRAMKPAKKKAAVDPKADEPQ